jgi:cytochrome b involved in lipid metabolism
MLKKFEETKQR